PDPGPAYGWRLAGAVRAGAATGTGARLARRRPVRRARRRPAARRRQADGAAARSRAPGQPACRRGARAARLAAAGLAVRVWVEVPYPQRIPVTSVGATARRRYGGGPGGRVRVHTTADGGLPQEFRDLRERHDGGHEHPEEAVRGRHQQWVG